MNSLRARLTLIFVAATALPLAAALGLSAMLIESSLSLSRTADLDHTSRLLETTGRGYYQSACSALRLDAATGRIKPQTVTTAQISKDPDLEDFWSSQDAERFFAAGKSLRMLKRAPGGMLVYSAPLSVDLKQLGDQYRRDRAVIASSRNRDLRRGFLTTLLLLTMLIWLASLGVLLYIARRVSKPIEELTRGLGELARGDFSFRLPTTHHDEIGRATRAFNNTAGRLEHSRDRLVHLTQLASWQVLARKTAHEIKNSLTPIRLTVEEMVARVGLSGPEQVFLGQAAQIVVEEVESLERRVRAFSEFSAEPPVTPEPLDVNAVVEERIAFLRSSHPEVEYAVRLAERTLTAMADQDLVKSILVNLLENAAEAAGDGGRILTRVAPDENHVVVEIHDSGPGLSEMAKSSLFQPTISFKKRGMGLGLSIARKSALLTGGDLQLIAGELGGAGFRLVLPRT